MTDVTAPPYLRFHFPARPAAVVVFASSVRRLPVAVSKLSPFRCRLPFPNRQRPPRSRLVKPVVMPSAEAHWPLQSSPPPSSSHSPVPTHSSRDADAALLHPRFPIPPAIAGRRDRLRRSGGEMLRPAVPAPRPRPRAPPPGGFVIGRAGGRRAGTSCAPPTVTLHQLRVQGHLHGTRALLLGDRRVSM